MILFARKSLKNKNVILLPKQLLCVVFEFLDVDDCFTVKRS